MLYHYTGFHGCDSHCEIEILNNLVIATEIDSNEGTSITNMAAHLATQVCKDFGIQPDTLIWIEHYPAQDIGARTIPSVYAIVQFNVDRHGVFRSPRWAYITPETFEAFKTTHANDKSISRF